MIRKVYEVDPMLCPQCGGRMKVIAFLTDYAVHESLLDRKQRPGLFPALFLVSAAVEVFWPTMGKLPMVLDSFFVAIDIS